MDLELSAVASVPLQITKGAQCTKFDLKYALLSRIKCVSKSETVSSFTGLPPGWPEVLFVCVLRPVLARGLPSRA